MYSENNQDIVILQDAARRFLSATFTPSSARKLFEADHIDTLPLWREQAEMGWGGITAPEDYGGSALGFVALAALQYEFGYAALPTPFLQTQVFSKAIETFGSPAQNKLFLKQVVDGEAFGFASLDEDLHPDGSQPITATKNGDDWTLNGSKPFLPWGSLLKAILVQAETGKTRHWFVVPCDARGVKLSNVKQIDRSTLLSSLELRNVELNASHIIPGDSLKLTFEIQRWSALLAAAEMAGAARRCQEMCADYVGKREQFGRLIGSFQAVRHMCADMLVAVENTECAVQFAAQAIDSASGMDPLSPFIAKYYANRICTKLWTDAIQVHGGIGFTWEYDLHVFAMRLQSLQTFYGESVSLCGYLLDSIRDEGKVFPI
jgi:alkylation response protein AidB-like acyl-CoA dehydrogenase